MSGILGHRGLFLQPTAGANDPYWANVSSLLHFDGSGTTLVDEKGKTWTCNGGATQSTSSPIVGSASALFGTSSSDYIYSQSSSDFSFGTGDFTIEFMMRPGAAGTQRNFLDVRTTPSGTTSDRIILYHPGDNSVILYTNLANRISSAGQLTAGSDYHIALVRASGLFNLFIAGTSQGTYSNSMNLTQQAIRIGSDTATDSINGKMDELRITKGVARYTSNFTPPSLPFPNG